MDWVKLTTNYYLDAAVMRAGEAAEVLFTRALAYVGDQETQGVVHREVLPRLTPARGTARAAALVREGLWEVVPDGWRFVSWDKHQTTVEQLEAKREAGRARQARHRTRSNGMRNAVTNASVTRTEVEVEVEAAAAATTAPPLPPSLAILRAALEARKLTVRWDRLTTEQATEIEALVAEHGDGPLVAAAVRAFQPDRPAAFVQAWLPGWRDLRAPGDLRVIHPPCDQPGHSGTTKHCAQCASEQKAAR